MGPIFGSASGVPGGDFASRFTWSPACINAVALQERDLNADDDLGDDGEVVYYLSSTLYSVYALVDADENVVERCRYDAYGEVAVLDPDGSADAHGLSDVEDPYTYTGRRLDAEAGLMQYRHRYYSSALGRFISRDPAGYADSMSLFAYGLGRPTLVTDPMGLITYEECECLCDKACDLVCLKSRVPGCKECCLVLCMASCVASNWANPEDPCSHPTGWQDCSMCQYRAGCGICCVKFPDDILECPGQCTSKPKH